MMKQLSTLSRAETEGIISQQAKPFLHKPRTSNFQDQVFASSRCNSIISNAGLIKNNEYKTPFQNKSSLEHTQPSSERPFSSNCDSLIILKRQSNQFNQQYSNTQASNFQTQEDFSEMYSPQILIPDNNKRRSLQQTPSKYVNQQNNNSIKAKKPTIVISTFSSLTPQQPLAEESLKSYQPSNNLSYQQQTLNIPINNFLTESKESDQFSRRVTYSPQKSPKVNQRNQKQQMNSEISKRNLGYANFNSNQYQMASYQKKSKSKEKRSANENLIGLHEMNKQNRMISLSGLSAVQQQSEISVSKRIPTSIHTPSTRKSINPQFQNINDQSRMQYSHSTTIKVKPNNCQSTPKQAQTIKIIDKKSQSVTQPKLEQEKKKCFTPNEYQLVNNTFTSRFNTFESVEEGYDAFNTQSKIKENQENIYLKNKSINMITAMTQGSQNPKLSSKQQLSNQPTPYQSYTINLYDKNFNNQLYSSKKCETVVNCEENQQINDKQIARTINNKSLQSLQENRCSSINSLNTRQSTQNMPLSIPNQSSNKTLPSKYLATPKSSHPILCFRIDQNSNNILGYSQKISKKKFIEPANSEYEQDDDDDNAQNSQSFFTSIATNLKNALRNIQGIQRKQCNCDPNLKDFQSCSRSISWLQRIDKQNDLDKLKSAYCSILENSSSFVELPFIQQIDKDLQRTYPHVEFFQNKDPQPNQLSEGLAILRRVLISFAAYDPQIGYVQGMNFIAAHFIFHAEEYIAFWLLVNTFELFEMRDIYLPNLPGLKKHCSILEQVLLEIDPELAHHMIVQGIKPEMYMTPWLFSLFGMMIPFEFLSEFYERMILEGWCFFYKVVLHILIEKRSIFMREELIGIMQILSANNRQTENQKTNKEWTQFLKAAQQIPLNRERVETLLNFIDSQQE